MTKQPARQNEWQSPREQWASLKPKAREIRKEPTPAEARLWEELRGQKVVGVKFRRQHAIDRFIVDFCSSSPRIVVEVDGEIHIQQREQDAARDDHLCARGYQVLRFRSSDVLNRIEEVLAQIEEAIRASE